MTGIFALGDATVRQLDGYTVTILPGGQTITAAHAPKPEQEETAAGMDMTAEQMNRGHDLTHGILAAVLGLPASPTLTGVASGAYWPHWWREEAAVLAFQAYAHAAGVDLEAVAGRLSDALSGNA